MEPKFFKIINSDIPTLVDFFSDGCGPCKTMKPILVELKTTVGSTATILKIDVEQNLQVANKYQIKGVPTLILFKKGEIKWRQKGVVSKIQLQKIILQHLN
jgi:thioredoxin 1